MQVYAPPGTRLRVDGLQRPVQRVTVNGHPSDGAVRCGDTWCEIALDPSLALAPGARIWRLAFDGGPPIEALWNPDCVAV